jgi:hypothetical protein
LPVVGVDSARKLLDPNLPSNTLINWIRWLIALAIGADKTYHVSPSAFLCNNAFIPLLSLSARNNLEGL